MALITLVGTNYAKEGTEFVYMGPADDCGECKLKGVCFNLDEGSKYRIKEVRGQQHDCTLYDDGKVQAVEVELIPTDAAISKKLAMDGGVITFQTPKCGRMDCEYYCLCNPIGKKDGSKCKIASVGRTLKCPADLKIVSVDLL